MCYSLNTSLDCVWDLVCSYVCVWARVWARVWVCEEPFIICLKYIKTRNETMYTIVDCLI